MAYNLYHFILNVNLNEIKLLKIYIIHFFELINCFTKFILRKVLLFSRSY